MLKSVHTTAQQWSGLVVGQSADIIRWSQCDPVELEKEEFWGEAVSFKCVYCRHVYPFIYYIVLVF